MRACFLNVALILCVSLGCATASASPITYTVSDTASGTIGGTAFTNQLVTLRYVSDTSGVSGSPGFYTNQVGVGNIMIGSGTPATLTDSGVEFFDNQNFSGTGVAGIGSAAVGSILDTESTAFETYSGTTSFPATSGCVFYNPGFSYGTSAGVLIFTSAGATSTFSATTPEPASLAMIGAGMLLAGVSRPRAARGNTAANR